jgi:hypothetical protein
VDTLDEAVGELQQIIAGDGYRFNGAARPSVVDQVEALTAAHNRRLFVRLRRAYARMSYRVRLRWRQFRASAPRPDARTPQG